LQPETGLLARLVDEYVAYYRYTEAPETSRLPHESRVFHPIEKQKINKDDMTPLVMEMHHLLCFRSQKWWVDVMFFPVTGEYRIRMKGHGQAAFDALAELAGVEDSAWHESSILLQRALFDFQQYEVYRRIPGIDYRQADKNKKEGPKDAVRRGKVVRTTW
jgi:hypothetical protein